MVRRFGIFLFLFGLATAVFAWCWGTFVADHIYNCTDSLPGVFDYFRPGDWVHAWKPVQFVDVVRSGRSMSEPDVIKKGWSVGALWFLWGGMIGSSALCASWASRSGKVRANPAQ